MHDPAAHHTPTTLQLEAWDASRRQDITNQIARLEQDRATATSTATTTTPATIQQKRAVREARRRQLAEKAAATAAEDADADTEEGTGAIRGQHGDAPAPTAPTTMTTTTSNAIYTISVPTTSDTLAWYDSKCNNNGDDNPERHTYTYETLDAARAAHVWSYPSNAEERARCEVFRDLWEKGYYMGGGSKFGGDWLVYPGTCALFTPSHLFHPFFSHVCVTCLFRRSAALSFALCCHSANLPICPVAPDGSSGAWSTWYSNEKGASFVWLGP